MLCLCLFETNSIAQADLELTYNFGLKLVEILLSLQSARITDVSHHAGVLIFLHSSKTYVCVTEL